MKLSNKQKIEIDFLSSVWGIDGTNFEPTEEEIKYFIETTVFGKGDGRVTNPMSGYKQENRILIAKRGLDIVIKNWISGIKEGILTTTELKRDFDNNPYILKIMKTIEKDLLRSKGVRFL